MGRPIYQTKSITLPVGNAGLTSQRMFLDRSKKKCTGLYIPVPRSESDPLNAENFQIGIKDNAGTYVDLVHCAALMSSPPQPMSDRFMSVDFAVTGEGVDVLIKEPVARVSQIRFDVILRLED